VSRRVVRKLRRDTVLFLFGLSGITYQTLTDHVQIALLVVFGLAAGIPGVASLLSLLPLTNESTTSSLPPQSSSSRTPSSLE
jgi:hypothetical protein